MRLSKKSDESIKFEWDLDNDIEQPDFVPVAAKGRGVVAASGKLTMLMIDCCSGLGGASQAMRARGWNVVTVDIDPDFSPDILADIRQWSWVGQRPDLAWFSVPCPEFSRWSMPWTRKRNPPPPDMSIYEAAKRIISECEPRFWVIENVRGAVQFFGKQTRTVGPFYLWGNFPPLGRVNLRMRKKESYSSTKKADRAMIPYALSLAMALAVEKQPELLTDKCFKVQPKSIVL